MAARGLRREPSDSFSRTASATAINEWSDELQPLLLPGAAELLGTFLFVFLAGSVVIASGNTGLTAAALGVGLSLAVLTWFLHSVSGAHLNPAVTVAVLVSGLTPEGFTVTRAIVYINAQFLGAILGSVLLSFLTTAAFGAECGSGQCSTGHQVTFLTRGSLSKEHGLSVMMLEFTCTLALVWVWFAVMVDRRSRAGSLGPLAVGFAMIVGVLAEGPGTGASMNPARTVGAAVAFHHYQHSLAPLVGTFFGGAMAGGLYAWLFLFDGQSVPDLYRITAPPGKHEAEGYQMPYVPEDRLNTPGSAATPLADRYASKKASA